MPAPFSFLAGVALAALVATVIAVILASRRPNGMPALLDARFVQVAEAFDRLASRVAEKVDVAELTAQVRRTSEQTDELHRVLANNQRRGQWGERIAEDVLRAAGFVEGVNYFKQSAEEGSGSRPDFTFPLPGGLRLNMDVKFPLENYRRALEAQTPQERADAEREFVRNVRARIREVATRGYIDPAKGTVDCALLLIPSESIYGLVYECDPNLMDLAFANRVVCCSPVTLFAVLAVVRQAADGLRLSQESRAAVVALGAFKDEWRRFGDEIDALGARLESTQKTFAQMSGPRRRRLDGAISTVVNATGTPKELSRTDR